MPHTRQTEMTEDELRRRIAALIALTPAKRPITIQRLAHIAGLSQTYLYDIPNRSSMAATTKKRLTRALQLVENDQVVVHKRPNKPTEIVIRPPQPPQANVARVAVDRRTGRSRVEFQAVNPNAFPRMPARK